MDLTPELKSVIESLSCPIHKQHPKIIHNEEKVTLDCCCPSFKVQSFFLIKKLSSLSFPKKNKDLVK
ncbi:MAG: hypothetical protein JWP44_3329 [Mucilaginibacter sp.]|nr:hypothetical protein [Mucilaginibacter sp.]